MRRTTRRAEDLGLGPPCAAVSGAGCMRRQSLRRMMRRLTKAAAQWPKLGQASHWVHGADSLVA